MNHKRWRLDFPDMGTQVARGNDCGQLPLRTGWIIGAIETARDFEFQFAVFIRFIRRTNEAPHLDSPIYQRLTGLVLGPAEKQRREKPGTWAGQERIERARHDGSQ